jgi:hypothetical protein
MEQIVYTVAAHRGSTASFSGVEYLRLVAARCAAFEALEQSLLACRSAFVLSDLNSILQWVEVQSSHCNEIRRLEQSLASHAGPDSSQLPNFLSPSEAERATELLHRTAELKKKVRQLNCTYAGLVRKASHNNAVLRNLYATALVYADPRIGPRASSGRAEE